MPGTPARLPVAGQPPSQLTGNAPDQAYNPSKHLLASCTATDFGLWTPEQKGGDRVSARRISPPLTGLGSRA